MAASNHLSRRLFLRGAAGAAVALPMLEIMSDGKESTGKSPCRMAVIKTPLGKNSDTWTPKTEGPNYKIPAALESVKSLRDDFSILSGLCHPQAWGGHDVEGASFLTGADVLSGTPGYDWKATISMDQLAAEHLGHKTRFPSLELMKNGSGIKNHTVAWSREGVALAAESDPAALFDRLFVDGAVGEREQIASNYRKKKSILDLIAEDHKRLHARASSQDKQVLDQYLTAVREVERRVKSNEEWSQKPKPAINVKRPETIRDGGVKARGPHMRAMMDLMVLAMQTDSTRILTYTLCDAGAPIPESGVTEGHHGVSHHGENPEKKAKLTKIDQFHVRQLGYFLQKLKETPDGDGNLLDHSMVLYGSGMGDPSRHSLKDLPILLAGHGAGNLKQGRHYRYESNVTPMSNLLLVMLREMGVPVDSFADSTGPLKHIV
ncbi:MAG: DUF1552 domain-containing protein [bacterium]|nr:DUF1552 domain-containing protein [bacterium]